MSIKEKVAQIQSMERELAEVRANAIAEAIAEAQNLIDLFNLQPSDFSFAEPAVKPRAAKIRGAVAAKYAGPNGKTWSGRGRTPTWIVEHEAQGGSRDDFLIK